MPSDSFQKNLQKYSGLVITGGSSGIGQAFITAINKLNTNLEICNLSRTKPDGFSSANERLHVSCDLSVPQERIQAAERVKTWVEKKSSKGKLLFINNSGFGSYGPFPEPDTEHQLGMLEVNVAAPVHLTGLLLPCLKEHGGLIINVASTAAFQPTPYMATYGATKAFLLHWSLALDADLKAEGVRTLALCPGPTSTNFFKRAGFEESPLPGGLGQTSEEVVEATLRAMVAGRNMVVSGWYNKLLTSISSRLPKPFCTYLGEKVLKRVRMDAK